MAMAMGEVKWYTDFVYTRQLRKSLFVSLYLFAEYFQYCHVHCTMFWLCGVCFADLRSPVPTRLVILCWSTWTPCLPLLACFLLLLLAFSSHYVQRLSPLVLLVVPLELLVRLLQMVIKGAIYYVTCTHTFCRSWLELLRRSMPGPPKPDRVGLGWEEKKKKERS